MKIYLDNNATTPVDPILKQRLPQWLDDFGNASSVHWAGRISKNILEECREGVAQGLKVLPEEIVFNSGATEGINTIFRGLFLHPEQKRNHLVVSPLEHAAVLANAKHLEEAGFPVSYLPVDTLGRIDAAALTELVNERTQLVAIMHANNEIGNINDIQVLSAIAKNKGAYFFSDTAQSIGKIPLQLDGSVDFIVASSHKLHGLKGVGFLYVRKGNRLPSLLLGGRQEADHRAGTVNTLGIKCLYESFKVSLENIKKHHTHALKLKQTLISGLKTIKGVRFFGDLEKSLPHTLNFGLPPLEGPTFVMNLDLEGIAASSGAACESGSMEPSHVLLAMGYPMEIAKSSVRLSWSRFNTIEEMEYTVQKIKSIVDRL
ncbi:MAG: cysteine desulfurase [Deltaproteobacteria bacterium]|nr:cysteine desulfurase [Deltaproteobacteria bacterium]